MLDVTSYPALTDLYCYYNGLSTLNVTNCPALVRLNCVGKKNKLSSAVINTSLAHFRNSGTYQAGWQL